MTLKDLGMTEEQAVYEIQAMREWDEYVHREIGSDRYYALCNKFARRRAEAEMRASGIPEDEIRRVCDLTDITMSILKESDSMQKGD